MNIMIDYAYRGEELKGFSLEALAQTVLAEEQAPFNSEVSISFVDDKTMTELNESYRHKEGPTDVLSFECDGVEEDLAESLQSEAPVFVLGDVIIAPDVAERQSAEYGTGFEGEIDLLLIHGLLHLCGYDHIDDADAEEMQKREKALLAAWTQG